MVRIRIGTRRSALAMAQSRLVAVALARGRRDVRVEFVPIVTRGDRTAGPLADAGGKALFTGELESALREGAVDVAVHSAKDLPSQLAEGTAIAAVPARADARDALLSAAGCGPGELPIAATVGTSSVRRAAMLLSMRPDLRIAPLRGNVDTRIRRVLSPRKGEPPLHAAVIAMAGVIRLGVSPSLEGRLFPLDPAAFVPAAGQGEIAVQALADRRDLADLLQPLDNPPSHEALTAERKVVRAMSADCHSCLAVHIGCYSGCWRGWAMAARSRQVASGTLGADDLIRVEAREAGRQIDDHPSIVADRLIAELDARDAKAILH